MKKFEKEELKLEKALKKEWLITNGIGGYASSTVIGCNTRKYHGLLIAPFAAPGRRKLILSKVDESLEIEGKVHNLYTNISKIKERPEWLSLRPIKQRNEAKL